MMTASSSSLSRVRPAVTPFAPLQATGRGQAPLPWPHVDAPLHASRSPRDRPSAMLHGALGPDDKQAGKVTPPPQVAAPPTIKSQLDYFAGTWTVRGLGYAGTLEGTWRGDWLFVTHPAMPDGSQVRFADVFGYEDSAYVRYDQTPQPHLMCKSGGWQDSRWEWQRVDCSARITYDKIDADTMIVTEEVGNPAAQGRSYKLVRCFEAQRQLSP